MSNDDLLKSDPVRKETTNVCFNLSSFFKMFVLLPLLSRGYRIRQSIILGSRVTRLGEFSPIGRLFYLGSFLLQK
jgi:hypothetical protein